MWNGILYTSGYQSLEAKGRKQTEAPWLTANPGASRAASPGSALTARGVHARASHPQAGAGAGFLGNSFYEGVFQNVNYSMHVKSWRDRAGRREWILLERAHAVRGMPVHRTLHEACGYTKPEHQPPEDRPLLRLPFSLSTHMYLKLNSLFTISNVEHLS